MSAQARRIADLEREVQKLSATSGHDDPGAERKKQEERIAFWDELRHRVDTERVDPEWRSETEPVIERVIAEKLGPEVSVAEVACASSICRAKLSHPSWQRIPDHEFTRFVLNRESLGTMELQLDTRHQEVTTLYFLRR